MRLQSGCKYIKFQTYEADSITLDVKAKDFLISDTDSLGRTTYMIFTKKLARPSAGNKNSLHIADPLD